MYKQYTYTHPIHTIHPSKIKNQLLINIQLLHKISQYNIAYIHIYIYTHILIYIVYYTIKHTLTFCPSNTLTHVSVKLIFAFIV